MIDRGTKPDMSTNRRPTLAVVVPTYNAPEALEANLESLARQADRPDEVLVADDGSKEPTRAVVDAFRSRLPLDHVWHPDDGFRLSEIRNKAIARSRCDYIVLLDGDTVAHRRFVEDHRAFAHAGRAVAAGRCGVSGFHGKPMPVPTPFQLLAWHLSGRIFNDTDPVSGLPVTSAAMGSIERRGDEYLWRDDIWRVTDLAAFGIDASQMQLLTADVNGDGADVKNAPHFGLGNGVRV